MLSLIHPEGLCNARSTANRCWPAALVFGTHVSEQLPVPGQPMMMSGYGAPYEALRPDGIGLYESCESDFLLDPFLFVSAHCNEPRIRHGARYRPGLSAVPL